MPRRRPTVSTRGELIARSYDPAALWLRQHAPKDKFAHLRKTERQDERNRVTVCQQDEPTSNLSTRHSTATGERR